ncbi:DUF4232 domain-containing protein [Streptomyces sp. NPDC048643]|uniref:DUF4232 domain-containing protein n=1 Tax=Streptomyces sp. NPDC048643 TaxID=3155637 RepID=UPI00343C9334
MPVFTRDSPTASSHGRRARRAAFSGRRAGRERPFLLGGVGGVGLDVGVGALDLTGGGGPCQADGVGLVNRGSTTCSATGFAGVKDADHTSNPVERGPAQPRITILKPGDAAIFDLAYNRRHHRRQPRHPDQHPGHAPERRGVGGVDGEVLGLAERHLVAGLRGACEPGAGSGPGSEGARRVPTGPVDDGRPGTPPPRAQRIQHRVEESDSDHTRGGGGGPEEQEGVADARRCHALTGRCGPAAP